MTPQKHDFGISDQGKLWGNPLGHIGGPNAQIPSRIDAEVAELEITYFMNCRIAPPTPADSSAVAGRFGVPKTPRHGRKVAGEWGQARPHNRCQEVWPQPLRTHDVPRRHLFILIKNNMVILVLNRP